MCWLDVMVSTHEIRCQTTTADRSEPPMTRDDVQGRCRAFTEFFVEQG
jgi:hypothetical protein